VRKFEDASAMPRNVRVRHGRQTSLVYARIFWKWSGVGCDSRTVINLPKSSRALANPSSDRYKSRLAARIVMREIVIVALACFLIGIMAAAVIVQLVP
jgi:hypothetical protein